MGHPFASFNIECMHILADLCSPYIPTNFENDGTMTPNDYSCSLSLVLYNSHSMDVEEAPI